MAKTFRSTISLSKQGSTAVGRVDLDASVVSDLGLRPGESVRATVRGQDFTGKVHGSPGAPGLLVPMDIVRALGLRDGQGVRVTVHGRP